ncbi:hypothetical protein G7046_g633 [Stylonectria norvegica]|nr:hypothetical protein G7046_g633 [Stylonectria norvegica]
MSLDESFWFSRLRYLPRLSSRLVTGITSTIITLFCSTVRVWKQRARAFERPLLSCDAVLAASVIFELLPLDMTQRIQPLVRIIIASIYKTTSLEVLELNIRGSLLKWIDSPEYEHIKNRYQETGFTPPFTPCLTKLVRLQLCVDSSELMKPQCMAF